MVLKSLHCFSKSLRYSTAMPFRCETDHYDLRTSDRSSQGSFHAVWLFAIYSLLISCFLQRTAQIHGV